MSGVDFAAVKALQLSSVVAQSIKLRRQGHEFVGCCPFHQDRTPSFTVSNEKGFAHCFGCGWNGDAADFVAAISGCGLREAVERLGAGDLLVLPKTSPAPNLRNVDVEKAETVGAARRIWREAQPIAGTPAELYLRNRSIVGRLPESLRFARLKHPQGGVHPCLVGIAVQAETKFGGIQRTYLTEDGRKADVSPVKMSLGRIGGCAIRLTPVAGELVVCEGIEDGLSLLQELGRAGWVAAGAAMLAGMMFPKVVRSVVIAADNDPAGEREAQKAAAAFADRGLHVRIMRPAAEYKDWNQQLMASGEAGREAA